ncbi:MAG: hypothetical protein PVF73_07070 [Bacteroidales bacterium]|jgi:hypothetical protein
MRTIIIFLFLFAAQQMIAQQPDENSISRYHQFDFWLGHWDVYKFGTDTLAGESRIESIIDSVGLLENYWAENSNYTGKSLNKYNPAKDRWEQYWIDNSGFTLYLSGGIADQKMVLDDVENGDPEKGLNRIVWEKLGDNRVRQTWSISKDNGKTWTVVFDGEYKRRQDENR